MQTGNGQPVMGDPINSLVWLGEQLAAQGQRIEAGEGGRAPLRIHGNPELKGIHYDSPVASAQVKSCLLLAGLFAAALAVAAAVVVMVDMGVVIRAIWAAIRDI